MTTIFTPTDRDGDIFEVETETNAGSDVVLMVTVDNDATDNYGSYLTRDAVDRLRAALAPFGTKPEPVKPEPVDPVDIVKGREYRLLPDAETLPGMPSSAVTDGVTRVRVVNPDSGYNTDTVRVRGLDGRGTSFGGTEYIVHPRFLAALPTEAPDAQPDAASPLDPARVAAVREAFTILGAEGHTVDVEALISIADYLAGDA
ncbi:hypothetical protein AB0J27_20190 [Micromonospora chokoriensis]